MSSKSSNLSKTNIVLLVFLVLLENANVLITRFTRMKSTEDQDALYDIDHLVMLTEASKLLLATALEVVHTYPYFGKAFQRHNLQSYQGLKVALPAALYFLQNTLFYVALSNLSSPVFQVSYQMKLLITAFVSVLLLERKYSQKQWICLLCLTCGITAAILAKDNNKEASKLGSSTPNTSITGLLAVVVASFCSALAGVTFEKFLKSSQQPKNNEEPAYLVSPSLYMRNIQLAFFSIVCAFLRQWWTRLTSTTDDNYNSTSDVQKSYLHGFTGWVWLLVLLRSTTGLLVASIVKNMDTVVKGIASGISVLFGCILAMFIFGTPLRPQFIFGALLVVPATYFFSNDLPKAASCPNQYAPTCITKKSSHSKLLTALVMGVLLGRNLEHMPDPYLAVPYYVPKISQNDESISLAPIKHPIPSNYKDGLHFVITVVNCNRTYDLSSDSGGAKALWGLHDALQEQGFSIGVMGRGSPQCNQLLNKTRTMNRTTVVVWPEVGGLTCPGNHSELINVRWILAPVEAHKGVNTTKWPADDLIFNYATSTGTNVPISNILQVLINPAPGDVTDIPREVFESTNRSGIAWMMRKGREFHSNITYIHNRRGFVSTEVKRSLDGPPNFESLRAFEYFVTYDPYTYWSWIAAMSGTVSVVYPLANTTKAEWALGTFVGSYMQAVGDTNIPGVAYGWDDEEIDYARNTMHELRDYLMKVKEWGASVTVPRFTRDAYRYRHGWLEDLEGALVKKDVYP